MVKKKEVSWAAGVTPEILALRHPRLYHMAEPGSWPSIQRHGLLSTTALLDLFEINGRERSRIESERRPQSVPIEHPVHGRAVIRDQQPMDDKGLSRALEDGLTAKQWYRLLNRHVFFWLTESRLNTLLAARAYRGRRQTIITVRTAELLRVHGDLVRLSPINSGATKPFPHPRGKDTFLSPSAFPFDSWEAKRGKGKAVVELAVLQGIPDIRDFVERVEEAGGGKAKTVIYRHHE
jgi:hypothetical protein